jgi:hypothetical protein
MASHFHKRDERSKSFVVPPFFARASQPLASAGKTTRTDNGVKPFNATPSQGMFPIETPECSVKQAGRFTPTTGSLVLPQVSLGSIIDFNKIIAGCKCNIGLIGCQAADTGVVWEFSVNGFSPMGQATKR